MRQQAEWKDVSGLKISPPYSFSSTLPSHALTTFRFEPTWGDGIRVIGTPGGERSFTSIGQLAAFFDTGNLVDDGGFEFQTGPAISGVWHGEGLGPKGVTRFEQTGHSGVNNIWLASHSEEWNAIVQPVSLEPRRMYRLSAWVRSEGGKQSGRIGVRKAIDKSNLGQAVFSGSKEYKQVFIDFQSSELQAVEIYVGYQGGTAAGPLQVDDVAVIAK